MKHDDEAMVQSDELSSVNDKNIKKIEGMEEPIQITAELGRAKIPVKDIFCLFDNPHGVIIELDTMSDEPIDLRVNDEVIARGEIVIIDGYFGVKIIEIAENVPCEKFNGCIYPFDDEETDEIDYIGNARLTILVEIGRGEIFEKDIKIGMIIKLDKLANEYMDIKFEGYLIGAGEIIDINNYIGVKIIKMYTEE